MCVCDFNLNCDFALKTFYERPRGKRKIFYILMSQLSVIRDRMQIRNRFRRFLSLKLNWYNVLSALTVNKE